MSDLARKKETVKKIIRSLLLSAPNGLALHELEKDYVSVAHERLPYRTFGHTDILGFAKTLTDVVQIQHQNKRVHLYGIADDSTKHIKEMVCRQRKTKRYTGLEKACVPSRYPKTRGIVANGRDYSAYYIRRNVYNVILKYCKGVSLTDFPNVYQEINGVALNVARIGFRSLPELLASMPDVVRLEYGRKDRSGNNLYAFPTRSLSKSHSMNCTSSRPKCALSIDAGAKNKSLSPIKPNTTDKIAELPAGESTATGDPNAVKVKLDNVSSISVSPMPRQHAVAPTSSKQPENKKAEYASPQKGQLNIPVLPSCQILKDEILQVLSAEAKGIWAVRIPALYKKKFGREMRIKELGYFSIIEFLSTLSDEVSITRPNPKGDWLLSKRSDEKISGEMAAYPNEGLEVTKMEIKELLIKAKDGLSLSEITTTYEKVYKHKIHMEDFNIPKPLDLVVLIKGICIYDKEGELFVTLTDAEKQVFPWYRYSNMAKGDVAKIPCDAVGPKGAFKQPTLPSQGSKYIDVFVSDVTSPGHFAVQICGKKTTRALEKLMDDLEQFYCSADSDLYKIPSCMITAGQICAAVFPGDMNWHRAVITAVNGAGFVDVLYVDYGSEDSVPIMSIRFLRSRFLQLPSQMIKARLAHIQPINLQTWTLASRNAMLGMCRDRRLVAVVTSIKDQELSLCLCDTTNPDKDIHINDTLVELKYAVFFPDSLTKEQADELRRFILESLESGDMVEPFPLSFYESNDKSENKPDIPLSTLSADASKNEPEIRAEDTTVDKRNVDLPVSEHKQTSSCKCTEKETCEECDSQGLIEYVKPYKVLDGKYTFHVINYEGNPMVTDAEISILFKKPSIPLVQLLLVKNLKFTELVLGNNGKHSKLFSELLAYEVPGVVIGKMKMVYLYRLEDVPAILRGLGHTKEPEITRDLKSILQGFCLPESAADADAAAATVPKVLQEMPATDIDTALQTLVDEHAELFNKRKMMLEVLADNSSPTVVDEIKKIEQKMVLAEEKIQSYPGGCAIDRDWESRDAIMVHNLLKNQYNTSFVQDKDEVGGATGCSTPSTSTRRPMDREAEVVGIAQAHPLHAQAKVAEVAPYIQKVSKDVAHVDEELAEIPGAQMPHNIVAFSPHHDAMLVDSTGGHRNPCLTCAPVWETRQVGTPLLVPHDGRFSQAGACGGVLMAGDVGPIRSNNLARPRLELVYPSMSGTLTSNNPVPTHYGCIPLNQNTGTQVCFDTMGRQANVSNLPQSQFMFAPPTGQVGIHGNVPLSYYIPYRGGH